MTEQNDTPFREVNRFQQISLVLTDIHSYLLGLDSLFPKQELPEILHEIIHNEINMLMLHYSFAYFGVKGQLVNQAQYNDAEQGMKELMGWEQKKKKNEVMAIHMSGIGRQYVEKGDLKKAIKICKEALKKDPDNPMVLVQIMQAYLRKGDLVTAERFRQKGAKFFLKHDKEKNKEESKSMAKKQLTLYLTQLNELSSEIERIHSQRSHYQQIFDKDEALLVKIQLILKEIRRHFRGKQIRIPEEKLPEALEDLMNVYFNWLTIISGAAYYMLKYKFGTEVQKKEVIRALTNVLGYSEQMNLTSREEAINRLKESGRYEGTVGKALTEAERQKELDEIQELESRSMMETQRRQMGYGDLFDIPFGYDLDEEYPEYFFVIDYEDEEKRKLMQNPDQKVIKSERITIVFCYPLSKVVKFDYESKAGFTKMDLFKHIYEGYKKIYDEEEKEVGDPGHYKYAYNRKRTHGKYGIWNHYIEDLLIERVSYSQKAKTVEMFIGS